METYIAELEKFASDTGRKKRPYIEGHSDRQAIREAYIKWRQLKGVVNLSEVSEEVLKSLDMNMESAFSESFEKLPNRQTIVNCLSNFVNDFKKHVIIERKIRGEPIELKWEDPVSHFETYGITKEFEETIRIFLKQKLKETHGDDWIKLGVPQNSRTRWKEREDRDYKEIKKTSQDIEYSDFGDYFEIIKQNWQNVFEAIFEDKEKTRIRFNDIQNLIRHPSAHIRKIDPDEVGHAKFTKRWIEQKIARSENATTITSNSPQ